MEETISDEVENNVDSQRHVQWIYGSKIEAKTLTFVRNMRQCYKASQNKESQLRSNGEDPLYSTTLVAQTTELAKVRTYTFAQVF